MPAITRLLMNIESRYFISIKNSRILMIFLLRCVRNANKTCSTGLGIFRLKIRDWFYALHEKKTYDERDRHEHAHTDEDNRVIVRAVEDRTNGPSADHRSDR